MLPSLAAPSIYHTVHLQNCLVFMLKCAGQEWAGPAHRVKTGGALMSGAVATVKGQHRGQGQLLRS